MPIGHFGHLGVFLMYFENLKNWSWAIGHLGIISGWNEMPIGHFGHLGLPMEFRLFFENALSEDPPSDFGFWVCRRWEKISETRNIRFSIFGFPNQLSFYFLNWSPPLFIEAPLNFHIDLLGFRPRYREKFIAQVIRVFKLVATVDVWWFWLEFNIPIDQVHCHRAAMSCPTFVHRAAVHNIFVVDGEAPGWYRWPSYSEGAFILSVSLFENKEYLSSVFKTRLITIGNFTAKETLVVFLALCFSPLVATWNVLNNSIFVVSVV